MGTVRSLAAVGVTVHAFILAPGDPIRLSSACRHFDLTGIADDEALLAHLIRHCRTLGQPPVIFPCSDAHALLLARHREALQGVCVVPATPFADLLGIVSKESLYRAADGIGVSTVPWLAEPDAARLAQWSAANAGPYLLKPFYEAMPGNPLRGKNFILQTMPELLDFAARRSLRSLIVQRVLQGGDGHIFDCYGYRDRQGRVAAMASHRRCRQYPPDFGSTSMGEIPAGLDAGQEAGLFQETARLLEAVKYHGIFGVEWLREQSSGRYYMIDFNARPFTTIGHLTDCGLNLPALAYADASAAVDAGASTEAAGPGSDGIFATGEKPVLSHLLWADVSRDLDSFAIQRRRGRMGLGEWLSSIAACRSFAYLSWSDPLPGLYRMLSIVGRAFRYRLHAGMERPRAEGSK